MLAFFRNGCLLRLHSLRPFSNHRLPFSTFPRRNKRTLREAVQSIVHGFNGSREIGAIVASFVGVFGLHLQLRSEIKADVDAVKGEIKQDLGKVEKQIDQLVKVWSGKVEAQDKMIVGQGKVIEGQDRKIESLFSRN